jgi:superfamily II DNA helicase RecQ
MGGKDNRVPVNLNWQGVNNLPDNEIRTIIRGADELIHSAGRHLLCSILKGSKEKKLLELGLDKSPSYGFYSHLPRPDIMRKIDWVIHRGYLEITYDWRMPLLVYSETGWEIERDTYSDELLQQLRNMLDKIDRLELEKLNTYLDTLDRSQRINRALSENPKNEASEKDAGHSSAEISGAAGKKEYGQEFKDTISEEFTLFKEIFSLINSLKDRNRSLIFLLIDKIIRTNDTRFIPVLKYWQNVDYKKVQTRLRNAVISLKVKEGV